MKQSAMKATNGAEALTRLSVLQSRKLPIRNCVKMPRMTAREAVAERNPRRWGCVISATYVNTCKFTSESAYALLSGLRVFAALKGKTKHESSKLVLWLEVTKLIIFIDQ